MCTNNVGVAKRIDVEKISKDIAELVKTLEAEVDGEEVNIPVKQAKKVAAGLEKLVAAKR